MDINRPQIQIIEITLSLLNLALWQCTFGSWRRGDRQQSERLQFREFKLRYWGFSWNPQISQYTKVKSAKILWKSKDLWGFHGKILRVNYKNTSNRNVKWIKPYQSYNFHVITIPTL